MTQPRMAILRLVSAPGFSPPEAVLSKMSVPWWAKLVKVETRPDDPLYVLIWFQDTTYRYMYPTPLDFSPPELFVDREGTIDWHSCDTPPGRDPL